MGEAGDSLVAFNYRFANSILRTPAITDTAMLARFVDVAFESPGDSVEGDAHFLTVDADLQLYDFHLDSLSTAIGRAAAVEGCPFDRDGASRGSLPDIGCYQWRPAARATSARW